jgi:hypothetical protein
MISPEICPDCTGAGGDNNVWCCRRCNGSGGIIHLELDIPDARKIIQALHDKELAWYERGKADTPPGRKVYCDIEAQALTNIRNKIERLLK